MATRMTFLLQIATNPEDRSSASPHIAGWSESWWDNNPLFAGSAAILELAQRRAALLPAQGSIVGYRLANYNIVGNKLLPTGSSTAKVLYQGNAGRPTDLPQVALEMSGKSSDSANTSRFVLRGMPDEIMVNGEYQPSTAFKTSVTNFCNLLVSSGWKFLGRNLGLPSARVLSVSNGLLTLDGAIGANVGDYIRFRRVFDTTGRAVKGSFRVIAPATSTTFTLAGFNPAIIVLNSGTARVDAVALRSFGSVSPSRAVIKKVGRPFESYRGRASKKTA